MKRKNAWKSYSEVEEKKVNELAEGYCAFLDKGKTERECIREIVSQAEVAGYVNWNSIEKMESNCSREIRYMQCV